MSPEVTPNSRCLIGRMSAVTGAQTQQETPNVMEALAAGDRDDESAARPSSAREVTQENGQMWSCHNPSRYRCGAADAEAAGASAVATEVRHRQTAGARESKDSSQGQRQCHRTSCRTQFGQKKKTSKTAAATIGTVRDQEVPETHRIVAAVERVEDPGTTAPSKQERDGRGVRCMK